MAKKKTTKKTTRKATPKPVPVYPLVTGTVGYAKAGSDRLGIPVDLTIDDCDSEGVWHPFRIYGSPQDHGVTIASDDGGLIAENATTEKIRQYAQALLQAADRIDKARGVGVGEDDQAWKTEYLVISGDGTIPSYRTRETVAEAKAQADDDDRVGATIHRIGPKMTEQEIADEIAREQKGSK